MLFSLYDVLTVWDKRMSSTKFNWCWHNTPTYAPYTVEAMNLPLILVSSGSAKSARSALLVLQSLTPNAQSVFRTLADYQLSHSEELGKHFESIAWSTLAIETAYFASNANTCLWFGRAVYSQALHAL